jgi:hypothetical protein
MTRFIQDGRGTRAGGAHRLACRTDNTTPRECDSRMRLALTTAPGA